MKNKKSSNSRNTMQRELVLAAVNSLNHPTAEEVYDFVAATSPLVSRATVYRNLKVLTEFCEISKIHTPKAADHFDMVPQKHFHAQCRQCGGIFDLELDSEYVEDLRERITDSYGFRVEGQDLIFKGICLNCQSLRN